MISARGNIRENAPACRRRANPKGRKRPAHERLRQRRQQKHEQIKYRQYPRTHRERERNSSLLLRLAFRQNARAHTYNQTYVTEKTRERERRSEDITLPALLCPPPLLFLDMYTHAHIALIVARTTHISCSMPVLLTTKYY